MVSHGSDDCCVNKHANLEDRVFNVGNNKPRKSCNVEGHKDQGPVVCVLDAFGLGDVPNSLSEAMGEEDVANEERN